MHLQPTCEYALQLTGSVHCSWEDAGYDFGRECVRLAGHVAFTNAARIAAAAAVQHPDDAHLQG